MKKISVNPEYLKISKKSQKKDKKKKSTPTQNLNSAKPNKIKKDLIRRIKEHNIRQKEKEKLKRMKYKEDEDNKFKNEFEETLKYLEHIKKKNKERKQKRKNKTMKNKNHPQTSHHNGQNNNTQQQYQPTHQQYQPRQQQYQPRQQQYPHTHINTDQNTYSTMNTMNYSQIGIRNHPPYGILKNGKKPTFRSYHKTLKNKNRFEASNLNLPANTPIVHTEIENDFLQNMNIQSERQQKLERIKNKHKKNKKRKHKIYTKRLRRKITLGKKDRKVGVLIKNNKTRKKIKDEHKILKKKEIGEIKDYLKKHNLIKIGTSAPENILRELYENAYLAGDIQNKNKQILLHNWSAEM